MTDLNTDGYAIHSGLIDPAACDALNRELAAHQAAESVRRGGIRGALRLSPTAQALITSEAIRAIVEEHLSASAFAVRSIFFDKTPESNWLVPWHQDTTIAVDQQADIAGYGPWSAKDGIPHVQPPAGVLGKMLTLRIHTDDCGPENGPLRVLPGSHRLGIQKDRPAGIEPVDCFTDQGGIVLMKPLTWHASSKAVASRHRRVLHVEWADFQLPEPLHWAHQQHQS